MTELDAATGPSTTFTYDARGSRTSSITAATDTAPSSTTGFEYTAAGALASVELPSKTVDYTTDARGLRQSRTVGTTTKDFTWSTVGGLPLLLDDGDHRYIYGPSSTPVAQLAGATVEYFTTDVLGTPRLITDQAGEVDAAISFDAYGTESQHTGTATTRFGYTGNWTDPDTGLLYLRARDYDAKTGQFLTVDPLVDQTRQPYAYTGNNPVQRTDPTGMDWWEDMLVEVGNNVVAAGAGALDGLTGGLSSVVLSALVPGYDCFIQKYDTAFQVGSVVAQVAEVVLTAASFLVPGAGLIVVGALAARWALKSAFKYASRSGKLLSSAVDLARKVGSPARKDVGELVDLSTAGRSQGGADAIRQYARRSNSWLDENGPQTIQSTSGPVRRDASSAARRERQRAKREGNPYSGQAGHVPDTAVSGMSEPPGGWLDMPGYSNQVAGGVLGSRVGIVIRGFTVNGVLHN